MNRFTLVVALAAACSSPAFAGSGKVRVNHAYNAYQTPSWVLPLPRSERLANALGGWNRGYPADPYWDPCLSYQRKAATINSPSTAEADDYQLLAATLADRPMRRRASSGG